MTHKQRLDLIERHIREHKYADLHTLAGTFDISLSTVRRALNELESKGILRRHHGGASLVEEDNGAGGYDFITQDARESAEKNAIARHLSSQIENGMTVLLDGGTTCYAVARHLTEKRLIIITNSLPIAALFSEIGSSETIVTGGTVYHRLGILYGPTCEMSLSQVHADVAILGAAGVTAEGIWNNNAFIISFQRLMRKAADRAVYVFDHTKWDRRALGLSCPLDPSFAAVTDREPPQALSEAFKKAGTRLEIAPAPTTAKG
ncbi:MAG: DeoR/GlpR family DNA-binding transcription regulator [Opitutales bacterium]